MAHLILDMNDYSLRDVFCIFGGSKFKYGAYLI
jgi:hypothetical protein